MNARQRKLVLREAVSALKRKHVFTQPITTIGPTGITGVFEDKKDGEDRIVVLHTQHADKRALTRMLEEELKGFQWKLVEQVGPVQGTATSGADVFHDSTGGQGTVGGWLSDPSTKQRYGFSNNHVIASLGAAQVGEKVHQAGQVIGQLRAFIILDQQQWNTADLAIFTVPNNIGTTWAHPSPVGNHGAKSGTKVYKHGSASRYTQGQVINGNGAVLVNLSGVHYWFNGVISIQGDSGDFSESGDSGALVLTMNHYSTAILFAKDHYAGYSYAFPISAANPLFRNLNYTL